MEDILKYAIENGIVDLSYVQAQIDMQKRNKYLDKHPWSISQGKDGKWRTYLPDKEKHRRMVKRNSKKELENVVIDFYKNLEEKEIPKTFDDVYKHWREVQNALVSDNTIVKYDTDYKRYFEKTKFSQTRIDQITEEDIKIFIVNKIKSLGLCKEACKTLYGYISNTIRSARINKLIYDDPMQFLEAKQFYKYCKNITHRKEDKVVTDCDMEKLYKKFEEDYRKNPQYIPTYAVELATLTGMRVGELSALTWDCIKDDYIIINKSEKYNRRTKTYFIDTTKNKKERIFPITKEIRDLLHRIKKMEMKYGYLSEYVFSNEDGRIHAPVISSCSKNKCRQIGINDKGIHAYRRTINSKLRCDGVSATVAASLLGHSEEVNERYYTFDVSDIKTKADIVSKVNQNIMAH